MKIPDHVRGFCNDVTSAIARASRGKNYSHAFARFLKNGIPSYDTLNANRIDVLDRLKHCQLHDLCLSNNNTDATIHITKCFNKNSR